MTLVTPQDDRRSGEATLAALVQEVGLARDPALQAYVQQLGSRLVPFAPASSFSYRFQVIDSWTPNAFALPGGSVLVSRGLLAIADSEDELAGALAHEIIHVVRRHAAARNAAGEKPFGVGELYWAASMASHARDQESDADRSGQEILAAAGYDPSALARLLRKIDQVEHVSTGVARIPSYFSTHPAASARAGAAAATAQQMAWQPGLRIADDRAAYLGRIEGVTVGDDQSNCALRFEGYHFLYPGLDLAIRFPLFGWELSCSASNASGVARVNEAVLSVDWDGGREDPKQVAGRFLADLPGGGLEVIDARDLVIEDRAAFAVRVWRAAKSIGAEHVWMTYHGMLFHIVAVAPNHEYLETVLRGARATAHSFRPLTREERQSIQVIRLAVVEAHAGETLEALGKRLGNTWNLNYTAAFNGVTPETRLDAGQTVKIAISEPLDR